MSIARGSVRSLCVLVLACASVLVCAAEAGSLRDQEVSADDGHPLRVWYKAPSDAPAARMLLLHGRTWSTRPDFDLQAPGESLSLMDGLVAAQVAAYGLDLRGYGGTPRDATGWLTPDRAAADVRAVLRWLAATEPDAPPPYLFGWSYGAMLAQLVAQRHPELIGGLILFGYPVRPGIAQDPEGIAGRPPRVPNTAAAARSDFIVPGSISPQAEDAFVTAALAADPVRADWRGLARWRDLDAAAITVPTLLLEGYHDPLALDAVQAELFAGVASDDKVWVVIPGGDHAAFLGRPRGYFLEQLETFVRRAR